MSSLLKNLLIALGISILLWIGYTVFISTETDEALLTSTGTVSEEARLTAQQLLLDTQKLKEYDVNGEVFKDPRFESLRDFRTTIPPENVGRENPFAPLGSGN